MNPVRTSFFLPLFYLPLILQAQETPSARQIIDRMMAATAEVKTLTYRFKKIERVAGTMRTGEQSVKYQHSPRKTYVYLHYPNKGTQVLWTETEKVLVKPTSFPYISVSLSPYSSIIRKNNHHTVHQIGFDYIRNIVDAIARQSGNKFNEYFVYQGETVFDSRPCYKILIDYKPFKYIPYTVKAGESLTSIAHKLGVSDYMMLQINPELDDYDDIKPGMQITVPTAYARRTLLYIDKETFLPIVQKMYDDKGLFSQYEFLNLKINPAIATEEFSRDYHAYNF